MITRKTLGIKSIYEFAGHHVAWLIVWMTIATLLYYFTGYRFLTLPLLPLSLIGTAVAFYVGFKNNQSYDRLWEARKVWGAIVNNSRMLGTMIKNFQFRSENNQDGSAITRQFVFRHIAYLYQLREQLLEPTQWEHVSLAWRMGSYNQLRKNRIYDSYAPELREVKSREYLTKEEAEQLRKFANIAVQILDKQSKVVQQLFQKNIIDTIQQIELQRSINSFYEEQGKAERIKKFPLPRHYGSFSFVFVCIFVFLLPFGILGELGKIGESMIWLTIPIGVIVGWVYVVMEIIGDYSENPFEGLYNDIPMLSICRTIEVDLLQMIGEKNIPMPIAPKNGILI